MMSMSRARLLGHDFYVRRYGKRRCLRCVDVQGIVPSLVASGKGMIGYRKLTGSVASHPAQF
jgi:hypothetical protein